MIYQFTSHSGLPKKSAMKDCKMFKLFRLAKSGKKLSREQKNYIARQLYGTFGSQSSSYKYMGFCAPFNQVLNRYIVNVKHYGYKEYFAPDKTSLRKALGNHRVLEIIAP